MNTIVVRSLIRCGGSPRCPGTWWQEENLMRVLAADFRPDSGPRLWPPVEGFGYVGACPVRLASEAEVALLEARERELGVRRVCSLWQWRPIPPAPR